MKSACVRAASVLVLSILVPGFLCAGELIQGIEKDMTEIVGRSLPFVVRITTEGGIPGPGMMEGLEQLFPLERRSGSGFIVQDDGRILTTENVIRGAGRIIVTLNDGRQYEARVVGKDPDIDVALLKIDADKLKCARIGDSDKTVPGSWVVCIGHPFGLANTVTFGIVSGKGRSGLGICSYEDFIQLDASINPGDSGGPVINSRGEVIGMMAAALSDDWPFGPRIIQGPADDFTMRRSRSISFAIPVKMAMEAARRLGEGKAVDRAWLGVHVQPVTPEIALAMNLLKTEGAIVVKVVENSPAERAGIKPGDVLVGYGGKRLGRANDLPYFVACSPVGEAVEIEVVRGGERIMVAPVLEKSPAEQADNG